MAYRMIDIYIERLGMHIIKKGFSARIGIKAERSKNETETSERQKLINQRRAEEKRICLILNNFDAHSEKGKKVTYGDRWITLTYTPARRPDFKTADKNLVSLLKSIKRKYKSCKYIAKTENTVTGAVHHHLIISRTVPHDFIAELWYKHCDHIKDVEIHSLADMKLANYFIKNEGSHKVTECKYHQSRNLVKPVIKIKKINSKSWKREPVPRRGFEIIDVQNYFDAVGFEAQTYVMVRRC